jgi:uncharacterized membrane protein (DUF2068 family)
VPRRDGNRSATKRQAVEGRGPQIPLPSSPSFPCFADGQEQRPRVALIGVFKLIKATLLIALGIAGLIAAPSDLAHQVRHALAWMGLSPGHHTLSRLLGKLGSFDDGIAPELAVASLCYAAVFLVEGIGLLKKRRWAEWLTVGVTASFIPRGLRSRATFQHRQDRLELVMRRYARTSTLFTSNRPVDDWGKVLGDAAAVAALLDRLLHTATSSSAGPGAGAPKSESPCPQTRRQGKCQPVLALTLAGFDLSTSGRF